MRKGLMAIVMTLMLGFTMVPYSSFAAAITNDSKASITINNTDSEEAFNAYKIIDISYNSGTNTVSAAFNSAFAEYFDGKGVSIDGFSSYASDSDNLKNLLSGLPAYINAKGILPTANAVATGDSVSLTNLPMGEYFIIPTATTSVYQLMLQKIEPVSSSGEYSLPDVTFNAKKKSVSVTKVADKKSVTKGETVKYTVTLDLPVYDSSATYKGFSVKDTLPTGLTLVTDSVSVQIDGTDVDTGYYDITKSDSGFKLKVEDGKYVNWRTAAMASKQLVITYNATLNAASPDVNVFENTVEYTYSTYPFTDDANHTKKKSANAEVKSYTIKVAKVDAGDTSRKLAGAEFDLYRTLKSGEDASAGIDIPGTATLLGSAKKGKLLKSGLTTGPDGIVLFKQYEANGTKYDYYLVETQAPAGYNLLQDAVKVNFTDDDVNEEGVYTVTVTNSSGFQLPITGDTGTILMSVIGLVLMGGAVVLLLLRKRKASRAK